MRVSVRFRGQCQTSRNLKRARSAFSYYLSPSGGITLVLVQRITLRLVFKTWDVFGFLGFCQPKGILGIIDDFRSATFFHGTCTAPLISSALNVPTATSYPSVNCLQWSSDGQLCFVTKTAIYILVGRYSKYCSTEYCKEY